MNPSALVEPDRVPPQRLHRPRHLRARDGAHLGEDLVYCGHESQVPNVGDYWTLQIGRQPMVMVRDQDRSVRVLYNRCPHRGVELCGNQKGKPGRAFVCSYHAWTFHLDGRVARSR